MTSSIAAIHVAKKQLGLDDDTYRAKLLNIVGKDSTRDMSETERQTVLKVFRNEGFAPVASVHRPGTRRQLDGKFAKKLQALWIAAWNLGIVRDRDDNAMLAFVKRQTGIDHTRFFHDAGDGRKAIEALKGWLSREAGVSFGNLNGQDWLADDGAKIAWAQWRILHPDAGLIVRKDFDEAVLNICHCIIIAHLKPKDWQEVSRRFGPRVRAAKAVSQ